ncbi:MAG: hypothetical protein ABJA61_07305, partial [Caldimonas sp.]
RAAFYAKADAVLDTSGRRESASLAALTVLGADLFAGRAPAPAAAPPAKSRSRSRLQQTADSD